MWCYWCLYVKSPLLHRYPWNTPTHTRHHQGGHIWGKKIRSVFPSGCGGCGRCDLSSATLTPFTSYHPTQCLLETQWYTLIRGVQRMAFEWGPSGYSTQPLWDFQLWRPGVTGNPRGRHLSGDIDKSGKFWLHVPLCAWKGQVTLIWGGQRASKANTSPHGACSHGRTLISHSLLLPIK